jgi:protocatechuate 3,4-dioxygenase, beta subunit
VTDLVTYRRPAPGTQPPLDSPAYGSTHKRHPNLPPIRVPHTLTETTAPRFDPARYKPHADMSQVNGKGALGERIIVAGRVTDEDGRPQRGVMVEVWQANAAGRYHHPRDQHDAPLDPNFEGRARIFTDDDGRYSFVSVKPGAYPWRNHWNAWRPVHIHFGLHGAALSGVAWKIGSSSSSGSPGKYIWVIIRWAKPAPCRPKWMCTGRQAFQWFRQG